MMIAPKPALVTFTVDGVSVVVDSKDAKDMLRVYPHGKIKRFRARRIHSTKVGHGPVRSIPVADYLKGVSNAIQ